ncbi:hypothetical protein B2G69_10595 [Methylorubrum zatmanii]|nr:recombinase family protein [Methylorubrum zatmanii]ARO54557.1 hypothetical protein B2G69_10595 [Methylorubrum zatmanii]
MARSKPAPSSAKPARLRCAVYTRKSSEEGLEQAFNSLDAQREACAAYIASQRHEGWGLLPTLYDDGGYSGGSMERPALQRLLADVAAGRVDVVVVYKVDRLTRALADFARIVAVFDARHVSFVSVTQAFNTTSSMGRLTLNVLLSFAQFEREVTGERIRDKIAASKRKGLWMGGLPPLGYDVAERKLVVNAAEADTVRHIFRRYSDLRSVRLLQLELAQAGIVSKRRRAADGGQFGGQPFARGALYAMLANRLYLGEVVHKGQSYTGEQTAIVDAELFAAAQTILAQNRVERDSGAAAAAPSLLAGLVYNAQGQRLTPSHTLKRGVRYRYYVSHSLITGKRSSARSVARSMVGDTGQGDAGAADAPRTDGQRLPALALEALVTGRLCELLGSASALHELVREHSASEQQRLLAAGAALAVDWHEAPAGEQRQRLLACLRRIVVRADGIVLHVNTERLLQGLSGSWCAPDAAVQAHADAEALCIAGASGGDDDEPDRGRVLVLSVPAVLQRVGQELRLVIPGENTGSAPDASLTGLLARAQQLRERIFGEAHLSIDDVARAEGLSRSYVTRLLRLSFLAPDIVARLLSGEHPPELTATRLMADTRLPMEWSEQRTLLGFR